MSRPEPAPDSSMEEILASIRRIISEDASPPKPQPAPNPKPVSLAPQMSPFAGPHTGFAAKPPTHQPIMVPAALPEPASANDDDEILDLGADYATVTRAAPAIGNGSPAPVQGFRGGPLPAEPDPFTVPTVLATEPPPPELRTAAEAVALPTEALAIGPSALPFDDVFELSASQPSPVGTDSAVSVAPPAITPTLAGILEAAEPMLAVPESLPQVAEALAALPGIEPSPAAAELAVVEALPASPVQPAALATPMETTIAAPAQASAPARTLEDAVADLLKPMLRDWLDANMPRIVEKMARDGQ